MTKHVVDVLAVLLDDPEEPKYGFAIAKATNLPSGTLYPILDRLEESGLIRGDWEDVNPTEVGRPARYNYKLTNDGQRIARQETQKTEPNLVNVRVVRLA